MFGTSEFANRNYERVVPQHGYSKMSADDFKVWQDDFRDRLGNLIGTAQLRLHHAALPLSPRQDSESVFHGYRCQKWYITSEPGIEVAFYLFIADPSATNCPLMMILHGHNSMGKEIFLSEDSREFELVINALQRGYAVIAPDVRAFGEMKREEEQIDGKPNSCEELQRRSLMIGRTLVGDRVYDVMRLLDFASTLPEIDEHHMIVNGHSGGGTVALFSTALDTRIYATIPASYFCTFYDSILSIRHCICNVIPKILELGEMEDVAMLCIPRPVLFIHGQDDPIFPVKGTRRAFSTVYDMYRELGVEERCQLHIGHYGHVIDHEPMWSFLNQVISAHS